MWWKILGDVRRITFRPADFTISGRRPQKKIFRQCVSFALIGILPCKR